MQPGASVLRDEVAAHYRERGYTIRERVQVRGSSGAIHSVDMVAQGPLGNLVIALEDAGGFEGPEMNAVRRAARDIGATPVVAARRMPEGLRRRAAEAGVVLLDASDMPPSEPEPAFDAPEDDPYPAWPDPERRREAGAPGPATKSTDPGFWRYPRAEGGPSATPSASGNDAAAADPARHATSGQARTHPATMRSHPTSVSPAGAAPMDAGPASAASFGWLPGAARPPAGVAAGAGHASARHATPVRPASAGGAATRRTGQDAGPAFRGTADAPWADWLRRLALAVAAGAGAGAAFFVLQRLVG